jgi:hypothetical protein
LLSWLALLTIVTGYSVRYECKVPDGTLTSVLQVLEATDVGEWSALDDSSRKAAGERTLKICQSSGCRDTSACRPFTRSDGLAYQRLGQFEYHSKGPTHPARIVLQGWNDADAGEQARSLGGVNLYELTGSGRLDPKIGTISVTEQSQIEIIDDSLLTIADFLWGKGESRYGRHRFLIRIWNLHRDKSPTSPGLKFRTRRKYPSLDETDTLDVIRHELPSIRRALRNRGHR